MSKKVIYIVVCDAFWTTETGFCESGKRPPRDVKHFETVEAAKEHIRALWASVDQHDEPDWEHYEFVQL